MKKTNAMRLLDSGKISYKTQAYTVDESDLSGVHVAQQIGVSPDKVFKTLVTKGDKSGINVFCIPVTSELNLKKAAVKSGDKKIEMIAVKDILALTGYIRGGCSPIGMKKKYPTYIDETAILFDEVLVSAGIKGLQIVIDPQILCKFTDAIFCDLTD